MSANKNPGPLQRRYLCWQKKRPKSLQGGAEERGSRGRKELAERKSLGFKFLTLDSTLNNVVVWSLREERVRNKTKNGGVWSLRPRCPLIRHLPR